MEQDPEQHRPRPSTAGHRLREAREAAGLTRGDVASRTKIAERHVLAIEEDRFGDLAARTYAIGFARAYARSVGLEEAEIAAAVRRQLDAERKPPERVPSFEPGDPARVPPRRLAWLAGGAVAVVIVALALFWGDYLSPAGRLPDLLPAEGSVPVAAASQPAAPPAAVPERTSGPVVLTAMDDGVWISVRDADGARLLERQLTPGESWTVPADARAPQLRTGRPDALRVTVGGKALPPLADRPMTLAGISLAAQDLLARAEPAPAPGAVPAPAAPRASARPGDGRASAGRSAPPAGDAAILGASPSQPTASSPDPGEPASPAPVRPEQPVSTETG